MAAIGLLASAACSSFGSDTAPEDGGTDAVPSADGGDRGDGASPPPGVTPTTDFCKAATADPRGPRFTSCFQYDDGAFLDVKVVDSSKGAGGGAEKGDSRSAPAALVLHYPANPPAGGNGASQRVIVPFHAKRVEIAYDVRVAYTPGTAVEPGNLCGFSRGEVHTNVLYDFAKGQISVIEQDQRTAETQSSVKGVIAVDLTAWHRITLLVDFESQLSQIRVDAGAPVEKLPLTVPFLSAPGEFVIGATYVANNTAAISYRFDDVVLHAW